MADFVNVIVVARDRLFREGLRLVIANGNFVASGATGSFARAAELLRTGGVQAQLIIGEPASDLEEEYRAIAALKQEIPSVKIVILERDSSYVERERAIRHGISGVLSQDLSAEALNCVLELVVTGGPDGSIAVIYTPGTVTDRPDPTRRGESQYKGASSGSKAAMVELEDVSSGIRAEELELRSAIDLSAREKQALECLVGGMSNKLIARRLDIAEATVKVHLRSLLRKLKVQNRTQAAIWATQNAAEPVLVRASTSAGTAPYLGKWPRPDLQYGSGAD